MIERRIRSRLYCKVRHWGIGRVLLRFAFLMTGIALPQLTAVSRCQDSVTIALTSPNLLEQVVTDLQGEDVQRRREAAIATRTMDRLLQRELMPLLIERVDREKDGQVRLAVLATLTDMGPDAAEAVSVLTESMRVDHGGRSSEQTHQDYRAALALAAIGAPAVESLRELLREPAANDRAEAAMALGRIGPAAAVAGPDLIRLLGDDQRRVRDEAIRALGSLGESVLTHLLKEIDNTDPEVCAGVIMSIGQIPGDHSEKRQAIRRALEHDQMVVRAAAIEAIDVLDLSLEEWQAEVLKHLQSPSNGVRLAAIHAVLRHPDRLAAMKGPLSELLHHQDDGVAQLAANLLYRIGPEVMPLLVASLERESSRVESISQAMALIGPTANEALMEAIIHPQPRVRQAAALALGSIRPTLPESVRHLAAGLNDPDVDTRRAFLKAIGNLEALGRPAVDVVNKLLGDSHPGLREEAIAVLFRIAPRDSQMVQRLIPLVNDAEADVQLRAIDALRGVGPVGREALPVVIGQLSNPSIAIRQSSATFVASHGASAGAAVEPLTATLAGGDPAWRLTVVATLGQLGSAAQASFSQLSELIDDPDPRIRAASVDAVGNLGLDADVLLPYLEHSLGNSDVEVQGGSLRIVRRLGNEQAMKLVPSILPLAANDEQRRSVMRAVERLETLATPPQAVAKLKELLSHEHGEVKRLAIRFLGQGGPDSQDSLEQLKNFLQDSDESIRREAESAIAKIEVASQ